MNDECPDLVSVIVPFLNGSHWLIEALQSVLNQTYTHWELIVMDDGSDDEHSMIAKDFCRQHADKMLYTDHKGHVNKGVSISRNEAVKRARGKYLAFLDADDVWMPDKLAKQLEIFATHPGVQVTFGAFVQWYSWRDKHKENHTQRIGAAPGKCYAPGTLNKILYPLLTGASPAPSGIVMTKEAFKRVNGFEPLFSGIYELYEDQAFLSKVYLHEVVFVSATADILYRKRDGSMSSAANNVERYYTVRAFFLDWLEAYLHQYNIEDEELNCLIKKARKELMVASQLP